MDGCVCLCFQALEEFRTQETSDHNSAELETKTEVARHNLRRAEVACVCVCVRAHLLRRSADPDQSLRILSFDSFDMI